MAVPAGNAPPSRWRDRMSSSGIAGSLWEVIGSVFLGMVIFCDIVSNTESGIPGTLGVALAHGLALAALIFALGGTNAGHLNMGVTMGFAVGEGGWKQVPAYIVGQVLGFCIASLLTSKLFSVFTDVQNGYGLAAPVNRETSYWWTFWAELVFSIFLVLVIVAAKLTTDMCVDRLGQRAVGTGTAESEAGIRLLVLLSGRLATALAGGLALAASVMAIGQFTGAAVNAGRNIGPNIIAGLYTEDLAFGFVDLTLIYVLPNLLGGLIAGALWRWVLARQVQRKIDEVIGAFVV